MCIADLAIDGEIADLAIDCEIADLAIDGEIGNFETSVKKFTIDQDNEVCTLSYPQIELFYIILSVLY